MAYLGNVPARSFISFERQVFTIVNSQTAYTLSHSVTNENDIRLVINNIVQEPGSGKAYTASGTTLTLSAALTNGTDEMYCVFLGRAVGTVNAPAGSVTTSQIVDLNVTTGKIAADAITEAKIADDAVESEHLNDNVISGQTELAAEPADTDEFLISDAGTLKRIDYSHIKGGGITEVDMWEMSSQTYSHDDWIDTGWSRFTDLSGAPHGTGLTESSGIFTFPSTGVYEVLFQTYFWNPSTTRSYVGVDVRGSTDAFASNYTRLGLSYTNTSTGGDHSVFTITCIYDVTNTSNNKIRFQAQGAGSIGYYHTKLITKKLMET
jgi:hypothetical protein